ncbi:MAG TPA: hypothetical protein PKW90_09325 [Myxococcota bacterium]|nr:hypothetical protein [Myxococcota bacterium]
MTSEEILSALSTRQISVALLARQTPHIQEAIANKHYSKTPSWLIPAREAVADALGLSVAQTFGFECLWPGCDRWTLHPPTCDRCRQRARAVLGRQPTTSDDFAGIVQTWMSTHQNKPARRPYREARSVTNVRRRVVELLEEEAPFPLSTRGISDEIGPGVQKVLIQLQADGVVRSQDGLWSLIAAS